MSLLKCYIIIAIKYLSLIFVFLQKPFLLLKFHIYLTLVHSFFEFLSIWVSYLLDSSNWSWIPLSYAFNFSEIDFSYSNLIFNSLIMDSSSSIQLIKPDFSSSSYWIVKFALWIVSIACLILFWSFSFCSYSSLSCRLMSSLISFDWRSCTSRCLMIASFYLNSLWIACI
jgi:hypothetical protein